jgi:hypothetical protein
MVICTIVTRSVLPCYRQENYVWHFLDFDQKLPKLKTETGFSENSEYEGFWKNGSQTQVLCLWYRSVALYGKSPKSISPCSLINIFNWNIFMDRSPFQFGLFFSVTISKLKLIRIGISASLLLYLMHELEDFENFVLNSVF